MDFPRKVQLVVAGSREEFDKYREWKHIHKDDLLVRYVANATMLREMKNCEVIYFGNYWLNPVFGHWLLDEVEDYARSTKCVWCEEVHAGGPEGCKK